jgi:hypothetical protein
MSGPQAACFGPLKGMRPRAKALLWPQNNAEAKRVGLGPPPRAQTRCLGVAAGSDVEDQTATETGNGTALGGDLNPRPQVKTIWAGRGAYVSEKPPFT